jgi:hypothetical protein
MTGRFIPNPGFQEAQCRRAAEKNSARALKEQLREQSKLLRVLQRELKDAKRDALEALNNQRETIAELQARAVPEGWGIVSTDFRARGLMLIISRVHIDSKVAGWTWSALGRTKHGFAREGRDTSHGAAESFNEAVKQAEKAGKKVKR